MRKFDFLFFAAMLFSLLVFISCGPDDTEIDCLMSGPGVVVSASSDPTCTTPGSITASSSGGKAPVVYSINGVDFQADATFGELEAGTYVVTARDANNCSSSTSVILSLQSDISVSLLATEAGCGGTEGTLTIETSGGSGGYTYSIDGSGFQDSPVFSNLSDGIHEVVVRDGECTTEAEALVPSGISFENEIAPIITASCALESCHGGSQAPDFRVFANIQEHAMNIKLKTGNNSMPPASAEPLTEEQISAIACWVNDGAKEN